MATKNIGQKNASNQEAPKQRPAFEARYGRLRVTVWRQESDKGPWYSTVPTRSYKDNQGNWKASHSLGRDDLLLMAKLLEQAHAWIWQHGNDTAEQSGTDEPPPF
jgi:hypothetical protein